MSQKKTCLGIKNNGNQCTVAPVAKNDYCRFHQFLVPGTIRCPANTLAGNLCRQVVLEANGYCQYHQSKIPPADICQI